MRTSATIGGLLLVATFALAQNRAQKRNYVPDAATAAKIAEAVLIPVYGQTLVEGERPYNAKLTGEVWTVTSTLWCASAQAPGTKNNSCVGPVSEVRLSEVDARIISMKRGN
ncbi:MAG: NTF2 fold immunity protein [Candidatus Acidiferrales bacterium]